MTKDETIPRAPGDLHDLAKMAMHLGETQKIDAIPPAPGEAAIVAIPEGRTIKDLTPIFQGVAERYRPARRKGTCRLKDLQSLIDWTNRFKGEHSALFANPETENLSLTCVANYHASEPAATSNEAGEPGAAHCDHRGVYNFPLSKEWKRWTEISGKQLSKDDLCDFIESYATDLIDPSPALLSTKPDMAKLENWEARNLEIRDKIDGRFGQFRDLVNMGRQFQVHETSDLEIKTDPDSGETRVNFNEEHKDAAGRKLQIANLFLIAIPVFESGDLFRLTVRFAYRKRGGNLTFSLTIFEEQRALDTAFDEAIQKARIETELPLFTGTPES
ncbi:DUF2303 family protein [Roseovarius sp. MMSF_3281]|uniref:DUF2303 family protein n=1 Tax=Roseovarius sp. MMSF_3281 TaxID=3046694 RepID=UPI00273DC266|nr:DUF2303 family protein [Roseovarius sp. MMSF_3281]